MKCIHTKYKKNTLEFNICSIYKEAIFLYGSF